MCPWCSPCTTLRSWWEVTKWPHGLCWQLAVPRADLSRASDPQKMGRHMTKSGEISRAIQLMSWCVGNKCVLCNPLGVWTCFAAFVWEKLTDTEISLGSDSRALLFSVWKAAGAAKSWVLKACPCQTPPDEIVILPVTHWKEMDAKLANYIRKIGGKMK